MRFMISYDLTGPEPDYDRIHEALERIQAERILLSQWCVRWKDRTAAQLLAYCEAYTTAEDRILITAFDETRMASRNLLSQCDDL